MINKIRYVYPTAIPLEDFELRDDSDGKGPYIAKWNTAKLGAQPTPEQLAAFEVQADAQAAKEKSNAAIKAQLAANEVSNLRALFENDAVRLSDFRAKQAALRAQLQ